MRALLIVGILSSAAAAAPLTLRLGHVDGGRITTADAQLGTRPDAVHAKLTLVLASPSRTAGEVAVKLALPPGATAVGLALDGTAGEQYFTADGRARYEEVVAWQKDPALLEQVKPGVLALRVYPVSREHSATVTIDLLLPPDASLVLARPGGSPRTFEASALDVFDLPAVGVDAQSSIVAIPTGPRGRSAFATASTPRGWRPHVQTLPGAPDATLADAIADGLGEDGASDGRIAYAP